MCLGAFLEELSQRNGDLYTFSGIRVSLGFLNWVIFSLHVRQFALYLVILCHSGRDKYFLHYSCFSKKLRILEGNCFFPRALSLHKCSQGSQSHEGDDLCLVTAEPRQKSKWQRIKATLASVIVSPGAVKVMLGMNPRVNSDLVQPLIGHCPHPCRRLTSCFP